MIPQLALAFTLMRGPGAGTGVLYTATAPVARQGGQKAPERPYKPVEVYDSANPAAIPHGAVQALYVDGEYAGNAADEAGHPRTLWIDVTGRDPDADVLDIEGGDAKTWQAGPWAEAAHRAHPHRPVILYMALDNWAAAKASVAAYHVKVKWWLAVPGTRGEAETPRLIPGADAVQFFWGAWNHKSYDISVTSRNFWTAP